MASKLGARVLVWAVYEGGLGFERFILEVHPGRVRLVFPSLRARVVHEVAAVPLFLAAFLGPLIMIFAFVRNSGLIVALILLWIVVLSAILVIFGTHIWSFMVEKPRDALDAQVIEVRPRVGGLRIRLAIRRRVASSTAGYTEDRWVAVGHRKKVLAALGTSTDIAPPSSP